MASTSFRPPVKEERKGEESWEKAKEAGKEGVSKAKEAGAEALEKTKEAAGDAMNKVREAGSEALGKAKETAQSVGHIASETAAAVGKKAEDLTAAAGHGIAGFGETMGKRAPHEGMAGKAAQVVAETIKESGKYLEEHKLSGMANDVEQVVVKHPIPALLIGFGLGFCLGRMMKD